MIRQIIKIDRELCNGCGLCVTACHEGAIALKDGKAVLIKDDYCDGLGDCLPACPTSAITFEKREAASYDAEAVSSHMEKKKTKGGNATLPIEEQAKDKLPCGCPSTSSMVFQRSTIGAPNRNNRQDSQLADSVCSSQLRQFPIQIQLVPVTAPYLQNCHLLIAADCTAFAYGAFHRDFISGKITLIGCPKLDSCDYAEKLTEILEKNEIASLTVVRMEVPCCGGIVSAVKTALLQSRKMIPWNVVTISRDGKVI